MAPRLHRPARLFPLAEHSNSTRACDATNVRETLPRSFLPAFMLPTRQSLGVGAPALAFDELSLDVVFGNEAFNQLAHYLGHRYGFNQIVSGPGKPLSFGGISGRGGDRIRPSSLGWAQDHPEARRAGGNIVAVTRSFRHVQINRCAAGIEPGGAALFAQDCPGLRVRYVRQHGGAPPDKIAPRRIRLAQFDDDTDGNTLEWQGNTHEIASRRPIGSPLNRFCGFMRSFRSAVIARIR